MRAGGVVFICWAVWNQWRCFWHLRHKNTTVHHHQTTWEKHYYPSFLLEQGKTYCNDHSYHDPVKKKAKVINACSVTCHANVVARMASSVKLGPNPPTSGRSDGRIFCTFEQSTNCGCSLWLRLIEMRKTPKAQSTELHTWQPFLQIMTHPTMFFKACYCRMVTACSAVAKRLQKLVYLFHRCVKLQ